MDPLTSTAPGSDHDAAPAITFTGIDAQKASLGILVQDPLNQRLLEAAAIQLDLSSQILDAYPSESASSTDFAIIVADEPAAQQILAILTAGGRQSESITPALVAVRTLDPSYGLLREVPLRVPLIKNQDSEFDGVLTLPLEPASLVAQLSLILYAHRAFIRRYHSTLEELHLNRRIFRSVTSGISVADATVADLPLVYVNPAFEVMTGYCLEEVIGKNCRFLQNDERDQPGLHSMRDAIREGRESVTVLKNFRHDGTQFWNELYLSPIQNRDGVVTHFVGIQTDVTARVEFEAALRESEKLAAVGRLAASIAHEINNPLESVMNLLYLAQHTEDMSELRSYLATADQELQRVSNITTQSLRFYKQSTKPQLVSPSELLDSVLSVYSGQLTNADVTVHRRTSSTRPVRALESEIRQVLNNLVSNAIDAMRGSGGRLLFRVREAQDLISSLHGVTITVADTGSGISPATMKQIYTAFFTTKGIGGTGLGLWISSEIVARHHGRLRVRSRQKPGSSGTVFKLFLPFEGTSIQPAQS